MFTNSIADSAPGPRPRGDLPPLRIHHLLACTVVTAMLFTMVRILIGSYSLIPKYIASANGIWFVVTSGIALTLVGSGFIWRRNQRKFFNQPGHWLLLLSLDSIAHFVLGFFDTINPWNEPASGMSWLYWLGSQTIFVVALVCSLVAAWKGFQSRCWRAFFLMQGLWLIAPTIFHWSQYRAVLWATGYVALMAMESAAVVADLRAHRIRDWVHWTGVAIVAVGLATGLAISLWPWLASWPN
jgi:hypothetical protein